MTQPQGQNGHGMIQQAAVIHLQEGQVVDHPLDDAGDEKLEQVHHDQAQQAEQDDASVGDQVRLYQLEGFHRSSSTALNGRPAGHLPDHRRLSLCEWA